MKRGGQRKGAGRPTKYGQPMKQIWVPISLIEEIKRLMAQLVKQKKPQTHEKNN